MPEAIPMQPTPAERIIDRQLITSFSLSSTAAFLEVLVGYTVAHWMTITASKTTGWIVSLCCFALILCGGLLGFGVLRKLGEGDETTPYHGRRLFMARLSLLLTGFCTLVVIAGTVVLLTLRPND